MKLGFIGLGVMGKPMAKNLVKAGHELVVFDIAKGPVDELVKEGAKAVASPKDVALACTTIVTMLPNSPHVKEVVCGANGILEGAKSGTIVIDMSSIAPAAIQEIAKKAADKGVKVIDAPVSGGEAKAISGQLSIMVGGDKAVFDSVKDDILLKMGASAVYCGVIGAGNTTKLANQAIAACNIAVVAEAFTLAKKAGVDPQVMFEAIRGGAAGSAIMELKFPMFMEGTYKPGFRIELHIKDLANALDTAHEVGSPMPLTSAVMEMFQSVKAGGMGQNDNGALAVYYEKISGVKIGK